MTDRKVTQLLMTLISLIKETLPALLVAWAGYVRNENARLRAKIRIIKTENKIKDHDHAATETYRGKSPSQVINLYLARRKSKNSTKPEP